MANQSLSTPATQVFVHHRKSGILPTPKFARKKLATHAVNVGFKCGHDCAYCSTGATLRTHPVFRDIDRSPFARGYAIVDPDLPVLVAHDAQHMRKRGLIQLCTYSDAWAPEAQKYSLGRRCLEAILGQPDWTVRILTKNAAVREDFDLIAQHRDRVLVGLSITATPNKADLMQLLEPHTSSNVERMGVLTNAKQQGLRTYAMLCPLLPGIADAPDQIDRLVEFACRIGAEEIFAEPLNPRGKGVGYCEAELARQGHTDEAAALAAVRGAEGWSDYVLRLVQNLQRSVRRHSDIGRLRFLLYPAGLVATVRQQILADDAGVVWLGAD